MTLPALSAPRFGGKQIVYGTTKDMTSLQKSLAKTGQAAGTPVDVMVNTAKELQALKAAVQAETIDGQSPLQLFQAYLQGNPDLAKALDTFLADTVGKGLSTKTDFSDLNTALVLTGEDAAQYQAVKPQIELLKKTGFKVLTDLSKTLQQAQKQQISASLLVFADQKARQQFAAQQSATAMMAAMKAFGELVAAGIVKPESFQNLSELQNDPQLQQQAQTLVQALGSDKPEDVGPAVNAIVDTVVEKIAATPEMAKALKFSFDQFLPLALDIVNVVQEPKTLGSLLPKLPIPTTVQALKAAIKKTGLAPEAGAPLMPNRTVKVDVGAVLTVLGHLAEMGRQQQAEASKKAGSVVDLVTQVQAVATSVPQSPFEALLAKLRKNQQN